MTAQGSDLHCMLALITIGDEKHSHMSYESNIATRLLKEISDSWHEACTQIGSSVPKPYLVYSHR